MAITPPSTGQGLFDFPQILQLGDDIAFPTPGPKSSTPKEVGSTWTTFYNGSLWPVIICDLEGCPEGFKIGHHEPNELPVILLGRHKYIWVFNDRLRDFDPNLDYLAGLEPHDQPEVLPTDDYPTKAEKQRRIAFKQDAMTFETADWWHNYIKNKSKARKMEAEIMAQTYQQQAKDAQKRRHSGDTSFSSGSRKSGSSGKKSYKSFEQSLRRESTSKRSKRKFGPEYAHLFPGVRGDEYDEEYVADVDNSLFMAQESDDVSRPRKERRTKKYAPSANEEPAFVPPEMGPNMCRILIGPHASSGGIIVPLTSLDTCDYLLTRQTFNNETQEHVVDLTADPRALELHLTESDFYKIYAYLHTSQIGPHPTTDPSTLSSRRKSKHAESLALAFITASKIQHEELQEVIQQKLCSLQPLPPMTMLTVAAAMLGLKTLEEENKVEKFLRECIVDHVAWDFWDIAERYGQVLRELMVQHKELRDAVLEKVGAKLEGEAVAKNM